MVRESLKILLAGCLLFLFLATPTMSENRSTENPHSMVMVVNSMGRPVDSSVSSSAFS